MNAAPRANDTALRDAVDRDDARTLAFVGAPGTGKTYALVRRAQRLARATPERRTILTAPGETGVRRLRRAVATSETPDAPVDCRELGDVAFALLVEFADPAAPPLRAIDDVAAASHFERVGADLFALEWTEFVTDEIDPEITGLRAPERFSAAAYRLIRKLRGSLISPEAFKTSGLQGATKFYGHPPNLAGADLIADTQPKYRDSLRVSGAELERQHAREVDLVKILARLYATYCRTIVARGTLTPIDAVYEATMLLRARPDLAGRARARFAAALVDDAQDLTSGQLGLLEAIFGADLGDVTFAGDPGQSTRGFATGARGGDVFKRARATLDFGENARTEPAIARAARSGGDPAGDPSARAPAVAASRDAVQLYRADSQRDEATFVANEIERLIAGGCAPERIAVVVRSLHCAYGYVDALLARDVPVDVGGATSPFAFPATIDALAALWSAADPFRHAYLLRALEAPWLRLSDASIATLCGDAAEPQPLLFALPEDDADGARGGRWDRRRDLRLARNVTRGDVDSALSPEARERIEAFRGARARWEAAMRTHDLPDLARLVLAETVVASAPGGARGRFEAHLVARLLDAIDAFAAREPLATLEDFLTHAEHVAAAEADLLAIDVRDAGAVRVLDVEAVKGEHLEAVFVVDVRAGAWPRYYVPDAFLFLPSLGMIPKDNVGDASAARTAKFTYAMFRHRLREKYNAEERRAFYVAATRARSRLYVSASGRPTRGVAAPEILAELERARFSSDPNDERTSYRRS